jgi:hypothetical protein
MTFHILGISSSQLTFIFFRGVGIPPTRLYRWHQSIHSLVVARVTFETQLFRHDLRYVVTGIVVQHKLHLVPVKTWCTCCSFVNLGSLDTGTGTHHLDQPTWSYAGVDRYALDNPNPNWLIFFRWVGIPPTSDVFLIVRTSKISLFEAWSARRTGVGRQWQLTENCGNPCDICALKHIETFRQEIVERWLQLFWNFYGPLVPVSDLVSSCMFMCLISPMPPTSENKVAGDGYSSWNRLYMEFPTITPFFSQMPEHGSYLVYIRKCRETCPRIAP